MMSGLSEDEIENFLAHVIKLEQCKYIKIEIFCACTVLIIHTSLTEVFVEMQHWTEVLFNSGINILGKGRAQKITHAKIAIVVIK